MVTEYQGGATVHELAKRFGIHRRTVGKHLRARGIDTTPPGLAPENVSDAVRLYEQEWSLQRIAEKYNTDDMTVRARLLDAGVTMRPRKGGLPRRSDSRRAPSNRRSHRGGTDQDEEGDLRRPGHARQLRPRDIDRLVAAYRAGATVYEVAPTFGIHRATVGKHLRARGIDTTPPGLAPENVPDAVRLYEQGWSLALIGEQYKTAARTVRARLLDAGVKMRDTHGRGR